MNNDYFYRFLYSRKCFYFSLACAQKYFGLECAHKCNNTCDGCNNVNGLCDSGCYPGWKGDYCNEGFMFDLLYV